MKPSFSLLLFLLPAWFTLIQTGRARRRLLFYTVGIALGLAGLYVSFSRSAWLAFLGGLLVLGGAFVYQQPRAAVLSRRIMGYCIAAALPLLLLLLFYGDLALSRMSNLEQPLEATSLNDRVVAVGLAQRVIERNWVTGVGLGNYYDYAKGLDAAAFTVHNIPLLMFAELGLPGAILWLWFVIAPFFRFFIPHPVAPSPHPPHTASPPFPLAPSPSHPVTPSPCHLVILAPWFAMLLIGLFDVTLWLTTHWQTAILFGLLLAHLNQPLCSLETKKSSLP